MYSKTFLKDHPEIKTTSPLRLPIFRPIYRFYAKVQFSNEVTPRLRPLFLRLNGGRVLEVLLLVYNNFGNCNKLTFLLFKEVNFCPMAYIHVYVIISHFRLNSHSFVICVFLQVNLSCHS